MAREAGMPDPMVFIGSYERFAALVTAADLDKVVRWKIGSGFKPGPETTIEDVLVELEQKIREDEREACAKLCETEFCGDDVAYYVATAIRTRG